MALTGVLTYEQSLSLERHIAVDVSNAAPRDQTSFLISFCDAFLRADRENFELLRPCMKKLIEKYELKCTCRESPE